MFPKMMKYEGKKKVSFDLTEENYNTLTSYSRRAFTSSSAIVNVLISRFLNVPDYIQETFAKACLDALKKERELFSTLGEFEQEEASERMYTYEYFLSFFGGDAFALKQSPTMKKVELKNGYAFIPNDWVELDFDETGDYIGVIEVRNRKSYSSVPHFYFLSEKPISSISDEEEKNIYKQCTEKFPGFNRILAMQIKPIYDDNKVLLNEDLWVQAPIVGIFPVMEYGTSNTYPFNAMIVRDNK